MNETNKITLYPSNWLYNAGVVGFLRALESCMPNNGEIQNFVKDDGSIEIDIALINKLFDTKSSEEPPLNKLFIWHWCFIDETYKWAYKSTKDFILSQLNKMKAGIPKSQVLKTLIDKNLNFEGISFDKEINEINNIVKDINKNMSNELLSQKVDEAYNVIKPKENFYKYRKSVGFLFSSGGFYQNLFNPTYFKNVNKFREIFSIDKVLEKNVNNQICHFCASKKFKTYPIDFQSMSYLFPAKSFVNAYWNLDNNSVTLICSLCKFILVHLHLGLTKLSDNSEIFINAPSFKIMWHLNNFAKKLYQKREIKEVKEILGMSLIEMASKIYVQLGRWERMNIEVVSKFNDRIEFFTIPSEIINILTCREISNLLNQIGEFKVLNMVLDGKFNEILNFAERIFRISLKPFNEKGKNEKDFINQEIKLHKNRNDLIAFSQRLFKLYALVEENINQEVRYG